jgi:hypothetical protein
VLHKILGTEESDARRWNIVGVGDEMIMRFPMVRRPCPFESADFEMLPLKPTMYFLQGVGGAVKSSSRQLEKHWVQQLSMPRVTENVTTVIDSNSSSLVELARRLSAVCHSV